MMNACKACRKSLPWKAKGGRLKAKVAGYCLECFLELTKGMIPNEIYPRGAPAHRGLTPRQESKLRSTDS